ncbi:family 43 glycosylhydrolase [Aliiglaciecola sp. NS0011-25]|uniref:family 43 glycosylhydrolase n=1 Tax=Aliiglaciecola sp. NS0011-25 TaxID=3127654 RepID=UPI00310AA913
MMDKNRRNFMTHSGAAIALLPFAAANAAPSKGEASCQMNLPQWSTGFENQRKAFVKKGQYLNPILAGDFPDPTILKDGDDYYMTHSSFDATPGILIWHSKDLVNWQPVCSALAKPLGTVFALDLVKHNGRYFIYIPFMQAPWSKGFKSFANIYVIYADNIAGPWSEPIDMNILGLIDPGHIVDESGQRYLLLSGINRIKLSSDGLSTIGPMEKAYAGWQYPDEWITEAYALEGPKLFKRKDWYYLVSAVGGTAGPATGHMVIVARSRTVDGEWTNCPHNPIVRTQDESEYWWSRGHATIFEGPNEKWYMVYHGYENGFRSLGRQTLLEPISWDENDWPVALGGDLSQALPAPVNLPNQVHGIAHSDDFSTSSLGMRWTLFGEPPEAIKRLRFANNQLIMQAVGSSPVDSAPLVQTVGDLAYEVSVEVELDAEVEAGLLLFFNSKLFIGMGHSLNGMTTYRGGKAAYWREPAPLVKKLHLKIVNDRQILTFYYSQDGKEWLRHAVRSEVSGYNANTVDDLQGLKPALFASGKGLAKFNNFTYRALS